MRIHHFNPEHEICLASGKANYTPPHAATRLRSGLGWMPAIWADKGDIVIVDDADYALKCLNKWRGPKNDVFFLTFSDLKKMLRHVRLDTLQISLAPWGWDLPFRQQLMRNGIPAHHLPSLREIEAIRQLAHRRSTIPLLHYLVSKLPGMTGERVCVDKMAALDTYLGMNERIVVKSPWSSSGRGVRYVSGEMDPSVRRWAEGVLSRQGSLIVEPYYEREIDFAMEFEMDHEEAHFLGFSLFDTRSGAYQGNWLAPESKKRERLSRYIDNDNLNRLIKEVTSVCSALLRNNYSGPFGIDMMVVRSSDGHGHSIHPCVEMNLRRTMGHVALALTPSPTSPEGVMYIYHGVNDELKVETERPFVKVI